MNKKSIITAMLVGIIASFVFILVQPLFGMTSLTSRHAAAYVALGGYGATSAMILSWVVHISVSVAYTLLSFIVITLNRSWLVNLLQVIIFGWITTLTATPANELVVRWITTEKFPALSSLAALNMEVGPKLWLHLIFFGFIVMGLFLTSVKTNNK